MLAHGRGNISRPCKLKPYLRNKNYHPLALLLSLAAHIALCFVIGKGRSTRAPAQEVGTALTQPVTVHLVKQADKPVQALITEESRSAAALTTVPSTEALTTATTSAASDSMRPVGQITDTAAEPSLLSLPEPRYFPANELSEGTSVLQDIPPEKTIALPDAPLQPARIKLLINEQGDIDKIVFEDSLLSDEARHFVQDSFATVKFKPGKIGDLAVKTQLRVEVTLERTRLKPITIFISGPTDKSNP